MNVFNLIIFSMISLGVYYIIPKNKRPLFLLCVSLIFYLLIDLKFIFLLILEVVLTYIISLKIKNKNNPNYKKYLFIGVGIVITVLITFKLENFFIDDLTSLFITLGLWKSEALLPLLMPVGISYYSFKIISYLVDTYNGKIMDNVSFIEYFLYITFFVQIMSGPIVRFNDFKEQLNNLSYQDVLFTNGFLHIVTGVFSKVVIADKIAPYVSTIFSSPLSYPSIACILAVFLYSIQLYCDFSGYSLIAIGIAEMFGVKTMDNFRYPYFSVNIKDFWSRWHISLSSWLRDYVYIPLGGNRKGKIRTKLNIVITFVVSGLWHGSSINFIIWGTIHGIWNALSNKKPRQFVSFTKGFWARMCTYIGIMITWIFFAIPSVKLAIDMIKHMVYDFSLSYNSLLNSVLPFTGDNSSVSYLLVLLTLIFFYTIFEWKQYKGKETSFIWNDIMLIIILFMASGASSFLYGQF